jgi:hypothetical protein
VWYDAVAAAVAAENLDRHQALDALLREVGLAEPAAFATATRLSEHAGRYRGPASDLASRFVPSPVDCRTSGRRLRQRRLAAQACLSSLVRGSQSDRRLDASRRLGGDRLGAGRRCRACCRPSAAGAAAGGRRVLDSGYEPKAIIANAAMAASSSSRGRMPQSTRPCSSSPPRRVRRPGRRKGRDCQHRPVAQLHPRQPTSRRLQVEEGSVLIRAS